MQFLFETDSLKKAVHAPNNITHPRPRTPHSAGRKTVSLIAVVHRELRFLCNWIVLGLLLLLRQLTGRSDREMLLSLLLLLLTLLLILPPLNLVLSVCHDARSLNTTR